DLSKQLLALRNSISELRVKMGQGDAVTQTRLLQYQDALFDDIAGTFQALKSQDLGGPSTNVVETLSSGDSAPSLSLNTGYHLQPDDLPPAIRNQFVGRTGKFLVQVFPVKDVWKHENQKEF